MVSRPAPLGPDEIARRAARVSCLLTDCDGVLTDASVYCGEAGEALLRFSRRDGMGFQRLREGGVEAAIVTRERSPIVARRAEKLQTPVHAGIGDKAAWLAVWTREKGVKLDELAYIGDDVNDLGIIAAIAPHGLCAAPADAEAEVMARVHLVTALGGGQGAFREFADLILRSRGIGQVVIEPGRRKP